MNYYNPKVARVGTTLTLVFVSCCLPNPQANAGTTSEALKAGRRLIVGKAASQGAKQATQTAGKNVAAKVAKESAETAARRGAANASRHFSKTAGVAANKSLPHGMRFSDDFAVATSKLTPQNQRRLLMLAPDLEAAGKSGEVIHLLAKGGKADEVLEFLWRNKGTIVGGAAVTAVLANPDKVLAAGGEYVVKPVVQSAASSVIAPSIAIASGLIFTFLFSGLVVTAVAVMTNAAFRRACWSGLTTVRSACQRATLK